MKTYATERSHRHPTIERVVDEGTKERGFVAGRQVVQFSAPKALMARSAAPIPELFVQKVAQSLKNCELAQNASAHGELVYNSATTEKKDVQKAERQDCSHHRRHRKGLDLATAKLFRQGGWRMFSFTGRRQKELDEAVKAIGGNVSGVQGDVAKLADLDRLYETIAEVKGRIDYCFRQRRRGRICSFRGPSRRAFRQTIQHQM